MTEDWRWRLALTKAFDRSFWTFLALCLASGGLCWGLKGRDAFVASLAADTALIGMLMPKIAASCLIAALVPALLPRQAVERWIGRGSGQRGIAIAALAGALMPGGPMTSFPLVASLQAAGAGTAVLIAFLTAWSVIGVQRIVMWEIPLMGIEFVVLRVLVSVPLPFVAAMLSRAIMWALRRRGDRPGSDGGA